MKKISLTCKWNGADRRLCEHYWIDRPIDFRRPNEFAAMLSAHLRSISIRHLHCKQKKYDYELFFSKVDQVCIPFFICFIITRTDCYWSSRWTRFIFDIWRRTAKCVSFSCEWFRFWCCRLVIFMTMIFHIHLNRVSVSLTQFWWQLANIGKKSMSICRCTVCQA